MGIMKWLTPTQAKAKLTFKKNQEVDVILLVQNKKEEYYLIRYIKWDGYDEGWLDAPLSEFSFGEMKWEEYKRIAIVEGSEHINKGKQKNGWPDIEVRKLKL
jgi:hypothetical protein